jgi:hypothetical protein
MELFRIIRHVPPSLLANQNLTMYACYLLTYSVPQVGYCQGMNCEYMVLVLKLALGCSHSSSSSRQMQGWAAAAARNWQYKFSRSR